MFGLFKKKQEDPAPTQAPVPDPAAEALAERKKEEAEIADLQSQISVLQKRRQNEAAEVVTLSAQRAEKFAQIASAPDAQKVTLAQEVSRLDSNISARNGTISLIDAGIRNNEDIVRQKINNLVAKFGAIENVVNLREHADEIRATGEKMKAEKIGIDMAAEANSQLLGTASSTGDEATIASIIAQAQAAQTGSVQASAPVPAVDDPAVAAILAAAARTAPTPAQ